MKLKFIFPFIVLCAAVTSTGAQNLTLNEKSPFSVGADLVSRYIWRGLNLGGPSPSIQPGIDCSFGSGSHSFSVGAWGAYSVSGIQTGQEADLYLSYTLKDMLCLTVTDYFFPDESSGMHNYFNYHKGQTGHVFEAAVGFSGTENIPICIMFAMNIFGDDAVKYKEENEVLVETNQIVMSKYLELGYSIEKAGVGFDLFAGACLDNPETEKGEPTGFYGQEKAGIINLGMTVSKNLMISESFQLPVFGSLIFNPEADKVFMVFGISL